jgi:aryl-alcohol dehydrogenase-like predicted oxidoreductase
VRHALRRDSVRKECEESLRRLGVETIDLYQIHWPTNDPEEDQEGWSTMAELQREGKVRWIGLSNWSVEQMEAARTTAPVTSLQPPYSLIHRDVEKEILPYCREHGIGVIVYSPMASGLLSGGMTRERALNLPGNDWRRRDEDFREPRLSHNLALVERLRRIGARHALSPGQVAIAWTLANPAVTAAIVGARSAVQVDGVMGAGDFRLSTEEIAEIETMPG